jgi:hypothetical protein
VLRRTLAEALSVGGQGSRDGGRTRGLLLRRAAQIAHRDLGDVDKAFDWLGDALVAHVESATLDALEELALEVEDLKRAEAMIGRALAEVFDGPLVRQLLARRVKLRREKLDDKAGAAEDLKKLHDLSPADVAVMDELSLLLTELGDFRGMVHVLEDQILRGKDPQARAELARKVARLWEEQLKDPREAADAWRRVLRMKPGDADAQAGLERAKTAMLTQPKPEPAAVPEESPAAAETTAAAESTAPAPEPAEAAGETAQEEVTLTGDALVVQAVAEAVAASSAGAEKSEALSLDEQEGAVAADVQPETAYAEPTDSEDLAEALAAPQDDAPAEQAADGVASADEEDILAVDDSELVDDSDFMDPPVAAEPPAPPPPPEPEPEPPRVEEAPQPTRSKRRR